MSYLSRKPINNGSDGDLYYPDVPNYKTTRNPFVHIDRCRGQNVHHRANYAYSCFECHAVHLRHVRLLLCGVVRSIFKHIGNVQHRSASVFLNNPPIHANVSRERSRVTEYRVLSSWAEKMAYVTRAKVAFVFPPPLRRENREFNFNPP